MAPALMKSAQLSGLTPPTATTGICFKGALTALIYPAPSSPAGKSLTISAPSLYA